MTQVFLTGASGYIGQTLAQRLAREGYQIRALAHRNRDIAHVSEIIDVPINEPERLAEAMRGAKAVIHCASATRADAIDVARETIIAGSENLIRAAQYAGIARVVFMSCADVTLSDRDRIHWDERKRPDAILDEFARAQALAEDIALTLSNDATEVVALRPAQVWGAEAPWLNTLKTEALEGGIRLHGAGETLIATTHIEHLIEATLLALYAFDVGGRAFYITDGEPIRALDFFRQLSRAAGWPEPKIKIAWAKGFQSRPSGSALRDYVLRTRHNAFDVQNAVKYLGFRPLKPIAEWMKALVRELELRKELAV